MNRLYLHELHDAPTETVAARQEELSRWIAETEDLNATIEWRREKFELLMFSAGKMAYMCGAGVSKAISDDALTWSELVEEFGKQAEKALNIPEGQEFGGIDLGDDRQQNIQNIMDRADAIAALIAARANAAHELHRLLLQPIFRNMKPHNVNPARILDKVWTPILTTNYDTLLEDVLQRRFSITHVDAISLGVPNFFGEDADAQPNLGDGIFNRSAGLFVVHLHGRYYDVCSEHGFCLTRNEYEDQNGIEKFLQFMEPFVTENSLVFIGADGTIEDSHFMALWGAIHEKIVNENHTPKTHYLLCRDDDFEERCTATTGILENTGVNICCIPCGLNFMDIWGYLNAITEIVA